MAGDAQVNRIIAWKFTCPVCGANCTTTVPVVNEPINVAMPPCPIAAGMIQQAIYSTLPPESPLGGVKVSAVGTIDVRNENNGEVLKLSLDVLVQ
jgi:hypothetical protein